MTTPTLDDGPPATPDDGRVHDAVVVGGGIVGLATALQLLRRRPGADVVVLEKEAVLVSHQTGRNSGVIHSGIYYRPDSDKLRTCREGRRLLMAFCDERSIPYELCGKLVVATDATQLDRLDRLAERAEANGIEAIRLGPAGITEHEPHARGVAALRVPDAGIVDYRLVGEHLAAAVVDDGGTIRCSTPVDAVTRRGDLVEIATATGPVRARHVVTCAGLHSDRLAERSPGPGGGERIVPFRGEYFTVVPERAHLVNDLIYPVPDPDFPFLGVHLTRMIDGSIHAGPNAVPALAREGYRWRDVDPAEALRIATFPGTRRLARRYWRTGLGEIGRSLSKRAFTRALQRLVPEIGADDLVPSPAGVRAQALAPSGDLLDDFVWRGDATVLNVVNAPSPAATASLAIGAEIAERVLTGTTS